jgi:hypothetical protein
LSVLSEADIVRLEISVDDKMIFIKVFVEILQSAGKFSAHYQSPSILERSRLRLSPQNKVIRESTTKQTLDNDEWKLVFRVPFNVLDSARTIDAIDIWMTHTTKDLALFFEFLFHNRIGGGAFGLYLDNDFVILIISFEYMALGAVSDMLCVCDIFQIHGAQFDGLVR